MPDMFSPLMYTVTGGEDALSARKSVMASYFDLARLRAEILTGTGAKRARTPQSDGNLFQWLDRNTARSFSKRWEAIKQADCTAYPVPNCSARLDAAFRETVTDYGLEGVRSFCSRPAADRKVYPLRVVCRGRTGQVIAD